VTSKSLGRTRTDPAPTSAPARKMIRSAGPAASRVPWWSVSVRPTTATDEHPSRDADGATPQGLTVGRGGDPGRPCSRTGHRGNGAVYVREIAQDRRADLGRSKERYESVGAPNNRLAELVERGSIASANADRRFAPGALPLADHRFGMAWEASGLLLTTRIPSLIVRLAPRTNLVAFREWALSRDEVDACPATVERFVGKPVPVQGELPHAHGVTMEGHHRPLVAEAPGLDVSVIATAIVDARGLVGVLAGFSESARRPALTLRGTGGFRDPFIIRALQAAIGLLEAAGLHGRLSVKCDCVDLASVVRIEHEGVSSAGPDEGPSFAEGPHVSVDGTLTVTALVGDDGHPGLELAALADDAVIGRRAL
jgi:hypothetical protein